MNELNYFVCCTVKPSKFEDAHERIIAAFASPVVAQDYIDKAAPRETWRNFYIRQRNISEY